MPSSNYVLFNPFKRKAKYRFRAAAILFYIMKENKDSTKEAYFSEIYFHT